MVLMLRRVATVCCLRDLTICMKQEAFQSQQFLEYIDNLLAKSIGQKGPNYRREYVKHLQITNKLH